MKLKVFTIYDNCVNAFNTPFFMHTTAEAIRAFQNSAKDPNTTIYTNPADFNLYQIGEWETEDAKFNEIAIRDLGSALLFKDKDDLVHNDSEEKIA